MSHQTALLPEQPLVGKAAVVSPTGTYRYRLERFRGPGEGTCLFVCLNPSTADAEVDDPTCRRMMGFAWDWGYRRLLVGNLFALRATNPAELAHHDSPRGRDNDEHLAEMAAEASIIVCAWGHPKTVPVAQRAGIVYSNLVADDHAEKLRCFGLTKHGHPLHPLYLKRDSRLIGFLGY